MKGAVEPLLTMAVILLIAAIALRVAWELLAPVLIPLSLVALGIVALTLAWRRR